MRVERMVRPSADGVVLDANLTASDEIVALVRGESGDCVVGDGWQTPVLSLGLPRIRAIGDDRLLLVDARAHPMAPNAFVSTRDGDLLHSFAIGYGIQDVLGVGSHVVVSYMDEGVFRGGAYGPEGLFVFGLDGTPMFGYHTRFGASAVAIADCYALAPDGPDAVWFFPYTDFPIVRLDLTTTEQRVYRSSPFLHGAHGLTATPRFLYFHGSHTADPHAVRSWQVGTEIVTQIGEWRRRRLRGVHGGRFLGVADHEVVVIAAGVP